MNSTTLSGKMVNDFKVITVGQKQVAKGTIAVDKGLFGEKRQEAKDKGYSTADFPQIEIWGSEKYIAYLIQNVQKGDKILVHGSIRTGSYDAKDGSKVYTTVINVDKAEFDKKETESLL